VQAGRVNARRMNPTAMIFLMEEGKGFIRLGMEGYLLRQD